MERYLVHGPGDVQGQPFRIDNEIAAFILKAYALNKDGTRVYKRAMLSRVKGRAKSEIAGALSCFEFLGPSRFADFQNGEPIGQPVQYPFIRCLATEETQSGNTYDNVRFMLEHIKTKYGREYPNIDVGLTRTILRGGGGEIVPSTAASASKDGGKETFAVADETHLYITPELRRMYDTVTRNLAKRKAANGWMLDTSTMYAIGEDSVAERTHRLWIAVNENRAKAPGLLFDHIQAPDVPDLHDTPRLRAALKIAYGPAAEWMDMTRLIEDIQSPLTKAADSRRYFLNQPSSDTDKYMDAVKWNGQAAPEVLEPMTPVVLGFDGSRKDDATFITASRISDGKVFQLACWERPPGPAGYQWEVPRLEVDHFIREAFSTYTVRSLWGDPSGWQSYLDTWNVEFVDRIVAVYPANQRKLMATGLDRFLEDITAGVLFHDGSAELTRHVLNAVPARFGQVAKPSQSHKIDGLISAVLAYMGRTDANFNPEPEPTGPSQYYSLNGAP